MKQIISMYFVLFSLPNFVLVWNTKNGKKKDSKGSSSCDSQGHCEKLLTELVYFPLLAVTGSVTKL